jgi:hypothetical protein
MLVRGLFLSANTSHTDACWRWIKTLTNAGVAPSGGFPARLSAVESAEFANRAPAGALDVYRTYRAGFARQSSTSSYQEAAGQAAIDTFWFFQALDLALHGKDVERELARAQQLTVQYANCVSTDNRGSACAVEVDPDCQGWQR